MTPLVFLVLCATGALFAGVAFTVVVGWADRRDAAARERRHVDRITALVNARDALGRATDRAA